MKVHNVRLGHATNSSSSHSIIFDPTINPTDDYDDFGWSYFTLSSTAAKTEYIAATLRQNLARSLPIQLVAAILRGLQLPEGELDSFCYSSRDVDHQSVFNLPYEFSTEQVSLEFFEEFKEYLLQSGVHILGGNDNAEKVHPLYNATKQLSFGNWRPDENAMICRKDGDWWILFDPDTGNRVVLSFKADPAEFKPVTPLLVDFKITDFCDFGCAYCYQGSTAAGQHINKSNVYALASQLAEAQVFEVAIGGGEPTKCGELLHFVQSLNHLGVKANFTTKNIEWLENERYAHEILDKVGAFAFSAENTTELDRIYTIFNYRGYELSKFTVQLIPATLNEYTFKSIMAWCRTHNVRVTLLGFKETGRGARFKEIAINRHWDKFDESKWIKTVAELHAANQVSRFSIDTTLAAKYKTDLAEIGIPDWLYHVEEGKYSMYVDGVELKYGPSSYHLDKLKPFELYKNDIAEMFANIEPV